MITLYNRMYVSEAMKRKNLLASLLKAQKTHDVIRKQFPFVPVAVGRRLTADDVPTEQMVRDSLVNVTNIVMTMPLADAPKVQYDALQDKEGNIVIENVELPITSRGHNSAGESFVLSDNLIIIYEIV